MRSLLLLLVAVPAYANPPENLDREAISEGVGKVKPKILACATSSTPAGTVKVKVEVAPSGSVTAATIGSTPDQALGDCVAAAMRNATFRATQKGGSFSYPFVFGGKSQPPPPPPPSGDPESLDRAAISSGIAQVKPQIAACGSASKAKGSVKVKIEVAPAGTVSSATITTSPDQTLGDCVAAAIKKATFKKTQKGGTFSYPFVF